MSFKRIFLESSQTLWAGRLRSALLALVLLALIGACSNHAEKKDVSATQRIISLSPHLTEMVYALHQEEKLIAVTDFCLYPPQAQTKEKIGGFLNPNLEKLIALKPDLLIGTPAAADLAARLRAQQIRTILLPNDTADDVFTTIDSLGRILGCRSQADSLKTLLLDSLNNYTKQAADNFHIHPTAVLVIGRDAGVTRNITVCGPGTFITSIWELAGGQNAFADLPSKYAQVSREALLTRNPQIIIEFKFNEIWNDQKDTLNIQEWQDLASIMAVERKQIYALSGNYTLIPGPRLYLLAKDFYKIIKHYHSMTSE